MRAGFLVVLFGSSVTFADAPAPAPKQPPTTPPALTTADPVPPVKGPITKLAVKASATIGGVKVTFAYNSHKHMIAGSGPAPGMWGFEFVRGGQKEEIELRHTEPAFEAEVAAKGALLVFRHIDYSNFEIVLAAAKAPKPLDDEACAELIDKAAAKRKFPVNQSASADELNGILRKTTPSWIGYCGTLTKRVWFAPPAPRVDRTRPK
jgi:hypothetical protein